MPRKISGQILTSASEAKLSVVAAIDFGTHGTGFAWAATKDLDEDPNTININFREQWGGGQISYPKNLSALMLEGKEVKYWGFEAKNRWARAAAEGPDDQLSYLYAFKMALKPGQYPDSLPRGQGRVRVRNPQDAYPLIVAYLERMLEVAIEDIIGRGFQGDQIRWCVTIPAIWDHADRTLMRRAAIEAGFPGDRLLLVQEPEAAAMQCRADMARLQEVAGAEGNRNYDISADRARFVVVDCGGGTVDITAYRVIGPPGDKQQLMELCRASGGKLGSEYLNRAFVEDILTKRLGGRSLVSKLQQKFPQEMLEIVDKWEQAKVNIGVRVDNEFGRIAVIDSIYLTIPSSIGDYVRKQLGPGHEDAAHRIVIKPAEIEEIFESKISGLLKEIEGRLQEIRKNAGPPGDREILLLVGGFAASKYLQESIKLRFHDQVAVVMPRHPAAAVLFGAVRLCHRPTTMLARRATYTYGYSCYLPFDEEKDPEERRVATDLGAPRCERFARVIQIGESVEVGKATETTLYPIWNSQNQIGIYLFATTQPDPRYPDDPGMKKLGNIFVDISESSKKPLSEREISLSVRFGEVEIIAEALNPRTNRKYRTAVDFEYY